MTGRRIAELARDWIGTPFVLGGRLKGVGADCAGLVIGVAREAGLLEESFDVVGYADGVGTDLARELLESRMDRVEGDPRPGDVLLLTVLGNPQHLAVVDLDPDGIIHAYRPVRKIAVHAYDEKYRRRTVSVWRFRGLEEE